ncbi:PREDICTED: protein argonaute-3-like [Vollenhovia emeryi]|uniref:protein argonaute-3-like n=1 Tax=Vollenhovia emeryi TaxID=411798 RepID=UPI0005F48A21|nr:PREDICTED: protein argonaute-3-like [Vollenhovia emeryi]
MAQEFNLSVSPEMEKVAARILSPPDLKYRDPNRPVEVRRGTWNLQHFNEARHLEDYSWTIVNLSGKPIDPLMQTFSKTLQSTARDVGMNIGQPLTPFKSFRLNNLNDITKYFSQNSKLKLIVVIIPDGTDIMYGKVKKITEMEVGVLTQCLKFKTLKKLDSSRPQFATVKNILLKINSKLNGINHTFTKMPFCLNEPCMLVGADVTHPSPDSKNIPAVAAVAANNDKSAFQYNVALRLQQPKEEIIRDLKDIILSQLAFYVRETNCVPKRIIYYRDGDTSAETLVLTHFLALMLGALS